MKFRIRTTPLKHLGAERSTESVYTASAFDDASPRHMLNKASPSIHHCSWISTPPHTPVDSCLRRNDGGGDSNVIPKHTPCHSERSEESPPFAPVRGLGGCSACLKNCNAPPFPVHPPLTSLRSFAPPYASEGGVHPITPSRGLCHSERSEESPPFVERKGARGMPTYRCSLAGR